MGRKKKDVTALYMTGSWNTYRMEEYTGADFITADTIVRGMKVFQRKFKVDLEMVSGHQLLFWTLTLLEGQETNANRSQRRLRKKTPIRVYKFAISSEEMLLFCNRVIPMNMKRHLTRAFACNDLKLLKLTNGDPVNLLMLYRQSKRHSANHLKLQHEEYLSSLIDKVQNCGLMTSDDLTQEVTAAGSKAYLGLGCLSDRIPCIQRVNVSITNVPTAEVPSLQEFRWSSIKAEVSAPSVFHLYREAETMEMMATIPEWLKKIRISGKTEVEARYI